MMAEKKKRRKGELTEMQLAYIDAYVAMEKPNVKQAAQIAGYADSYCAVKIYSKSLVKHPLVMAEIKRRQQTMAKVGDLSLEEVLAQLKAVINSNPQDFFRADGTPIPLQDVVPEAAAAVSSLTILEYADGRKKVDIKFWDKVRALEQVAKLLGFTKPAEGKVDKDDPDRAVRLEVHDARSRIAMRKITGTMALEDVEEAKRQEAEEDVLRLAQGESA